MNKVYVVNRGGHDYSAAERYGHLVFCTDGSMPRYNTNQMFREIAHAMRDSAPGDYILLTSLTTLNVIAAGIFAAKHGRLNLLLFQSKRGQHTRGEYLERTVVLKPPQGDTSDRGTVEEEESEDIRGGAAQSASEDRDTQGGNG